MNTKRFLCLFTIIIEFILIFIGAIYHINKIFLIEVSFFIIASLVILLSIIHFNQKRNLYCIDADKIQNIESNDQVIIELKKTINNLEKEKHQLASSNIDDRNKWRYYLTIWLHQIKSPISAIKLLLNNPEKNQSKIKAELLRIENYSNMIMGFLKTNTLDHDYLFEKVGIEGIVKELTKYYAPLFISKHLKIEFKKINLIVNCDRKWLSFIIAQILDNALKYTNKGSIKIYQDNNSIVIEDTGIGIAKEELSKLFIEGYTGINGHSEKNASGLGLNLCKKIADELAINIKVESIVKQGTKVFIIFQSDNIVRK